MEDRACAAGIGVVALAAVAVGQGCPPGVHPYGPATWDLEVEQIVVDHYAAAGSALLTPAVADYERAERDIDLIRAAIGGGPAHIGAWEARVLVVKTNSITVIPKLTCANTHFQARMMPAGFGMWWLVEFPRGVNLIATGEFYRSLPEVTGAEPNMLGGVSCTVFDSWTYQEEPGGTWRWRVFETYGCGPGGWGCCSRTWIVRVSAAGALCFLPDCNDDGELTVADFGCFQTRFALNHAWADCNQDGALTVADFACYQTKFVAGCD